MTPKAAGRWAPPEDGPNATGMCLAQVQQVLDAIAPPSLAESWDNVGLLFGTPAQVQLLTASDRRFARRILGS